MVGLRFYTNDRHPQSWFTDGTLDWLWPAAERAQLPVALGAAMFLPTVGQIAERHPGLKLIVDHMGVPRSSKGEAAYRFQSPKRTYAPSRQVSPVSRTGTRPTFPRTGSLDRREGKSAIFDEPKSAVSKPAEGK